jgi:mRNA interferase YafQ
MKRSAAFGRKFERDTKLMRKRGKNMDKLESLVNALIGGESLPEKYYDHKLGGEYVGYRECHVEPDWLLIYKLDGENIYFGRTGTHSDLFE